MMPMAMAMQNGGLNCPPQWHFQYFSTIEELKWVHFFPSGSLNMISNITAETLLTFSQPLAPFPRLLYSVKLEEKHNRLCSKLSAFLQSPKHKFSSNQVWIITADVRSRTNEGQSSGDWNLFLTPKNPTRINYRQLIKAIAQDLPGILRAVKFYPHLYLYRKL